MPNDGRSSTPAAGGRPRRPDGAALPAGEALARLDVRRAVRADPGTLCRAVDDLAWLGRLVDGPPDRPDLRRVEADLAFALRSEGRDLIFRKAALVDIGSAGPVDGGCAVELGWRASSFAPLFPVFAGRIVADATGLHLRGIYAPPGGGIGLLVDQAFLRHFARRTATWFLDRLAEEMEKVETSPTR